ncbi:hypothetical protein P8452_19660 [Trifolium repens]|nr:hypothetical protein P8452_19660 [Trifolium repens]
MNQTPAAEYEFNENLTDLAIPSVATLPTNSQELMNEQSMHQQRFNQERPLGEIDATIKSSQGMEICVEDGTTSPTHSKPVSSYSSSGLSTTSKLETSLPGVEGGAKLTNAKTITSSTHLELVSSSQEQNVDVRDFQETTKTNNDQVPLNGEAFMKVSSIIEEQFSKEDPSPSNSIPLPFSFETHSMPFQGNPSQKVEDLSPASMSIAIAKPLTTKDVDVKDSSSPSTVIWELEQLVSKNCLDYKNLSLLTDFLVKHPSVLLRDTSLGNKYKGYAYICLAELLQFLQTHSVLDVLGSSRSEFVELLQEVRSFDFDKDWLDSVERRALFSDIQVSQDALQKLLESKQQVSKEVEVLRLKIDILNQHVEDLKHQLTSSEAILESIILQEAQVVETKAALSAPLGY